MKSRSITTSTLPIFGAVLLALAPVSQAFAAQDDIALLQSYVGSWSGRGTVQYSDSEEALLCRMTINQASEASKINYKGRCGVAGGTISFNGTMAYVEAQDHFEAVMSSNAAFSGQAVGRRQGKGIAFSLTERNSQTGNDNDITAGIALKDNQIAVDFNIVDKKTGDAVDVTVPFSQ